ncbi:hypothetical protein AAE478_006532 [Parahypoxylon ruwenzoriense]
MDRPTGNSHQGNSEHHHGSSGHRGGSGGQFSPGLTRGLGEDTPHWIVGGESRPSSETTSSSHIQYLIDNYNPASSPSMSYMHSPTQRDASTIYGVANTAYIPAQYTMAHSLTITNTDENTSIPTINSAFWPSNEATSTISSVVPQQEEGQDTEQEPHEEWLAEEHDYRAERIRNYKVAPRVPFPVAQPAGTRLQTDFFYDRIYPRPFDYGVLAAYEFSVRRTSGEEKRKIGRCRPRPVTNADAGVYKARRASRSARGNTICVRKDAVGFFRGAISSQGNHRSTL